MIPTNRLTTATLGAAITACALWVATPLAKAVIYVETGDAGQTLATARSTGTDSTTVLNTINGNIAGTNGLDADLYRITITSTTTFSATASSTAGIDTSLFLFNSAGVPIIANDDMSNTSLQAAIPMGNPFLTSLAAGTYYLGISLSGNEAVNFNNQLLFTTDQPTTSVRGIASGLNPTTLGSFNGNTFFAEGGAYSIALTGANTAVPEPSTWALTVAGTTTLCLALTRRKRRTHLHLARASHVA